MIIKNYKRLLKGPLNIILLSSLFLSGCSTYSNSFSCSDSRGASCTSMDKVYGMILSGEIERFNRAKKNCRGRRCKSNLADGEIVLQSSPDKYVPTHYTDIEEVK